MSLMKRLTLSTATAALLSVPLASGSAIAQTASGTDSSTQSVESDTATQNTGNQSSANQSGQAGDQQDAVVATVDGEEIRRSDVMTVIGVLPPEIASQPPEMLVPMAMQQLILRELILQQARSQNLAEDPDVIALVEGSNRAAEEDAMVQVWVDREMEKTVTDEAVEQVYSDLQEKSQEEVPPLEQIRSQIEQYVRQQRMQDIAAELQQGADIVLFDATGQPIERPQTAEGQDRSGASSGDDPDTAAQDGADTTGDDDDAASTSSADDASSSKQGG